MGYKTIIVKKMNKYIYTHMNIHINIKIYINKKKKEKLNIVNE